MNRSISLGAALALMMLVAFITFNITFDYVTNQVNNRMIYLREREEALEKFSMLNREVRANFYGTIDELYLLDSMARGFIAGIGDPYAVYFDARTFERIQRAQTNPVADIGAALRASPDGDGYIYVEEVFPDSPALAAGIQPGDFIVRIDEVDLTPENSTAMLESISGDQGTRISLTIRSENVDREEELIRRIVPMPSVFSHMIEGTRVGYMHIMDFNQHTQDQVRRERDRLLAAGAQSIIFDVRDVSGGEIAYAARVLDSLIPAGVIVSSRDRYGEDTVMFRSSGSGLDLPMVVLQNGGTRGPAELFALVLRDYDLSRGVGTTTAGKGVVQELIPLVDGSAIELTVALLVSPSGLIFNGTGVRPDYEVAFDDDWRIGVDEYTDPQLRSAVELAIALHGVSEALEAQEQEALEQEAREQEALEREEETENGLEQRIAQ